MTEESIKKMLFASMGVSIIILLVMLVNRPKMPSSLPEENKLVDSDGDGLPDVLERALGTDALKKDTDGDGYADLEEIKSGFNPLDKTSEAKLSPDAFAAMKRIIEQIDPELYKKEF